LADAPDARVGVAGERIPPQHLAAAAAARAVGRARRVRRALRRSLQCRQLVRLVAESGHQRHAPGALLCATPGAPPREVVELVPRWSFRGALRAVPATGPTQHRHRHPGRREVFISAALP
jgi:hypothetical protein